MLWVCSHFFFRGGKREWRDLKPNLLFVFLLLLFGRTVPSTGHWYINWMKYFNTCCACLKMFGSLCFAFSGVGLDLQERREKNSAIVLFWAHCAWPVNSNNNSLRLCFVLSCFCFIFGVWSDIRLTKPIDIDNCLSVRKTGRSQKR